MNVSLRFTNQWLNLKPAPTVRRGVFTFELTHKLVFALNWNLFHSASEGPFRIQASGNYKGHNFLKAYERPLKTYSIIPLSK
jgi:hypothetical protein